MKKRRRKKRVVLKTSLEKITDHELNRLILDAPQRVRRPLINIRDDGYFLSRSPDDIRIITNLNIWFKDQRKLYRVRVQKKMGRVKNPKREIRYTLFKVEKPPR